MSFMKESFLKISASVGSQCFTNGARDWTRTSMLLKAPPSEDGMSTNFTTRARAQDSNEFHLKKIVNYRLVSMHY